MVDLGWGGGAYIAGIKIRIPNKTSIICGTTRVRINNSVCIKTVITDGVRNRKRD